MKEFAYTMSESLMHFTRFTLLFKVVVVVQVEHGNLEWSFNF